jgi:hypothetical protein
MNNKTNLEIIEIDYSVSPGGVNSFEVYDRGDEGFITSFPIFESENLTEAVQFCYNLGQDFTVRTLAQYFAEMDANV